MQISTRVPPFMRQSSGKSFPLRSPPRRRGPSARSARKKDWVPAFAGTNGERELLRPGSRQLRLLLEAVDLLALHHGEADIVEPVEQAVLAVGVDLEAHHAAVGPADFLLLEIDRERGVGAALGVVEQLLQILRRDLDRQ